MAEKKEYIVQIEDFTNYGKLLFVGGMFPDTELIRCRNCKYHYVSEELHDAIGYWCDYLGGTTESDGFCSWAERKEE